MLRPLAVSLNVLVIFAGGGFVYGGAHALAGVALFLGGMNLLMLRHRDDHVLTFWPIVVNLALVTVGNLGTMYGIGYRYGNLQENATLETQRATGALFMTLCPLLVAAGIVTCVVSFRQLLVARRKAMRGA